MGGSSPLSESIFFFVLHLFAWPRLLLANQTIHHCLTTPIKNIGVVLDLDSLMGKQQKVAMEIAVQEFNSLSCSKLDLNIQNSKGISARTIASGNVPSNNLLFHEFGINFNNSIYCHINLFSCFFLYIFCFFFKKSPELRIITFYII